MNKRVPKKPIVTDEPMRRLIYSLLANSIDEYDRLGDYREPIKPEEFPKDMPEARKVMEALLIASDKQVAPDEKMIAYIMFKDLNMTEQGAHDVVHNIMGYVTEDRAVNNLSVQVAMDVQRRRVEGAMEEAVDTLEHGEGKLSDRLERAVTTLSLVNDKGEDDSVRLDQASMAETHKAAMRQRVKNRKAGISNGPSLKFKGFIGKRDPLTGLWLEKQEGKIPVLRWGATTLVTGLPGRGKTIFGQTWAEYNAWELGIDTLYILNETDPEDLADRSITRETYVPTDYLKNVFDIDNQKDPAYEKVMAYYDKISHTKADVNYLYCPGWNVFKINTAISLARRLADRRGRGLLVVMDYYNLIDASNFGGERSERLGQVALSLREGVKRENIKSRAAGGVGVHMIVFAQETENKTTGETYAFGSKEIIQYAQIHISINRQLADFDSTMGGAKNTVGGERFWCRKGEWSHKVILKILKANYDSLGEVEVWIENQLVRVYDPLPGKKV